MASNPCEVETTNEDEGYGSFLTASSSTTNTSGAAGENSTGGASSMSNVDLLIRVSCCGTKHRQLLDLLKALHIKFLFGMDSFVLVFRLPGSDRVTAC